MEAANLVTVIIPVYNREAFIKRAIDSVLNQTFKDWQLFVVDDCSTDQSSRIASGYDDARIKVHRTAKNSGAAAARNVGIRHATSRYIALLDSDDMYHPEFLAESLQAIKASEDGYGFSYTGVGDIRSYNTNRPVDNRVWMLPERLASVKKPYLYQLHIGTAAGIILKRVVFDKVGFFDEAMGAAEDTDWFIRASEYYKGLAIHKTLIFKDNDSKDRLTVNYEKNAKAYKLIIAKQRDEIHHAAFLVSRWYYKSMWLNFYIGDRAGATSAYRILKENHLLTFQKKATYLAGLLLPTRFFIRTHKQLSKLK